MYHLIDPKFHEPQDALESVSKVLGCLSSMLGELTDGHNLNESDLYGLALMLQAVSGVMTDAAGAVQEPYHDGYQKGSKLAVSEYRRGYREGCDFGAKSAGGAKTTG